MAFGLVLVLNYWNVGNLGFFEQIIVKNICDMAFE
jgi:hypothetical protein